MGGCLRDVDGRAVRGGALRGGAVLDGLGAGGGAGGGAGDVGRGGGGAEGMPLEVGERLWERPGPVQDSAGAPRLLIVYPRRDERAIDGEGTRYAGRVEPEGARVTLNGRR